MFQCLLTHSPYNNAHWKSSVTLTHSPLLLTFAAVLNYTWGSATGLFTGWWRCVTKNHSSHSRLCPGSGLNWGSDVFWSTSTERNERKVKYVWRYIQNMKQCCCIVNDKSSHHAMRQPLFTCEINYYSHKSTVNCERMSGVEAVLPS